MNVIFVWFEQTSANSKLSIKRNSRNELKQDKRNIVVLCARYTYTRCVYLNFISLRYSIYWKQFRRSFLFLYIVFVIFVSFLFVSVYLLLYVDSFVWTFVGQRCDDMGECVAADVCRTSVFVYFDVRCLNELKKCDVNATDTHA